MRNWEIAEKPDTLKRVEIASPEVFVVATPELVKTLPRINHPSDLLTAPLVHEGDTREWTQWLSEHGVTLTQPLSGPRLWHAHLTLNAARRGQGIILTNRFLLEDDLASGRLVQIGKDSPHFKRVSLGSYVFMARQDRWQSIAISKFRQWLVAISHKWAS